jgi:hypothetical protein
VQALEDEEHPAHRSARTAKALLRKLLDGRVIALMLSALLAALGFLTPSRWPAVAAAMLAFAAVIAERIVFFRAAAGPRMPGGVPS